MAEVRYYVCDACGCDTRGPNNNDVKLTGYVMARGNNALWLCRVCRGEVEGALREALSTKVKAIRAQAFKDAPKREVGP